MLVIILSCNSEPKVSVKDIVLTEVKDSGKDKPEPSPPIAPNGLKVTAFLIYNDSTSSSFDVLNDSTKALWNVIGGGGDAEKPSEKTKVIFWGREKGVHIKILNGKKKVIDETISNLEIPHEFIIDNTGCSIVKVFATKGSKKLYEGRIPFHCGE